MRTEENCETDNCETEVLWGCGGRAALALVRKCVLIATANVTAAGSFLLLSPRCCVRHHAGALSPSRWRALRVRPLSRFRLASDWTGSERWD